MLTLSSNLFYSINILSIFKDEEKVLTIVKSLNKKSDHNSQQLTKHDTLITLVETERDNFPECKTNRRSRRSAEEKCPTKLYSCPDCEQLTEEMKSKACTGFDVG